MRQQQQHQLALQKETEKDPKTSYVHKPGTLYVFICVWIHFPGNVKRLLVTVTGFSSLVPFVSKSNSSQTFFFFFPVFFFPPSVCVFCFVKLLYRTRFRP